MNRATVLVNAPPVKGGENVTGAMARERVEDFAQFPQIKAFKAVFTKILLSIRLYAGSTFIRFAQVKKVVFLT